jgi:acyl dehydratase
MKSSLFGERIAHGLLVLSIQQGLLERTRPARAQEMLVGIKWKFKGPVKIGDTLHVRARITTLRDSDAPGWGTVLVEREVVNQLDEVVQSGETEHLVGRRAG